MADRDPDGLPNRFSELEAKQILSRAAQIDASGANSFTADDLRAIAADATISQSAILHALNEAAKARTPTPTPTAPAQSKPLSFWRGGIRTAGLIGVGLGLGLVAMWVEQRTLGQGPAVAVLGPSAVFMLYRALRHRWHGSLTEFLREVLLVLGPFTMTIISLEGSNALRPALLWSMFSAAVGSAIVSLQLHTRAQPAAEPNIETD